MKTIMSARRYALALSKFRILTISALLLFTINQQSVAQLPCNLVNSIGINTGYNYATSALVAAGAQDPAWEITALTPDLNSLAPTYVPPYYAYVPNPDQWTGPTSTTSKWLSFLPGGGVQETNGSYVDTDYLMTAVRQFRTCLSDSITFTMEVAADNYCYHVMVDGIPVPSSTPFSQAPSSLQANYQDFATIPTFKMYLAAGTHTLTFVIGNDNDIDEFNPMGFNVIGTISSATGTTALVGPSSSDSCSCESSGSSSCTDSCYWRVLGNNILNGNNIFGTLTNNDINVYTDNTSRGIITRNGYLGWNTLTPETFLDVNCTAAPASSGIRFEDLQTGRGYALVIDPTTGFVYNSGQSAGIQNSCVTTGQIPVVSDTAGDLACSEIYDNGTSVGIGTTGSFSYTWAGGGLTGTNAPPSSGNVRLDVAGVTRSLAYIATSDARFKTNIVDIEDPFSIINGLRGRTYNWNDKAMKEMGADGSKQYGFIAQEVQGILPEAVIIDGKGNYGLNYNAFIPVLVESQKALYKLYSDEKQRNDTLESDLRSLEAKVDELSNCCANSQANANAAKSDLTDNANNTLYQNVPNPFGDETVIGYDVEQMQQSAYIIVCDLSGKELLRYPITNKGKGSIQIGADKLSSGMFVYALIVDGFEVGSKKMTLLRQ